MRRYNTSLALVVCVMLVSASFAQQASISTVPNLIRYGGSLKDVQGAPLAVATTGVTFAIYKQQEGGAPMWMETQNVTSDADGNYSVLLGSTTSAGLPDDLFSQQEQRWLGVQISGQAEQPRVLLVSVPYAFKAHDAETLGGISASEFALAKDVNSSSGQTAAVATQATSPASNAQAAGQKGAGSPPPTGPTDFTGSNTSQIVAVAQSGTGAGLNASAPSKALVGTATAATGTSYGVEGSLSGTGGAAVLGNATAGTGSAYGIEGRSSSTSGIGVRGMALATSGQTYGVSGYVASAAGTAGVFNNVAGGEIITGQNGATVMFSVDGSGNVNSAGTFNFLNSNGNTYSVLSIGSAGDLSSNNLWVGVKAGTGSDNHGGADNVGTSNTFAGASSGSSNTSGFENTFLGYQAGSNNSTGLDNTFLGVRAGYLNTGEGNTGENNTFVGYQAGLNSNGDSNIFLGFGAGANNTTGNDNVYISNSGPTLGTESNAIRIGTQGSGDGQQNVTYIAGIYQSTVDSNGIPVNVDDNGQLGTVVSSRRFKEQIADMGDSTNALMRLRPVTFYYKAGYAKGDRKLQYGLIAEEVAPVYPELVAYDKDGQPFTVRYQYLAPMLLNELQKECRRAEAEAQQIKTQQQEIESLRQQLKLQNASLQERLTRVESLLENQRQTVAEK